MKFIVEVPRDDILRANADGINRQQIAKLIREELRACGGRYMPIDWEQAILKHVTVKQFLTKC